MLQTTTFLALVTIIACTGASVAPHPCTGRTHTGSHAVLGGSQHVVMSAYREHRQAGAVRVLAIVDKHQPTAVDCVLCCSDGREWFREGSVQTHSVHYGYPYVAADIICEEPADCHATQVALSAQCGARLRGEPNCDSVSPPLVLMIHNQERREDGFPVFLSVCMSTVFGNYSNILQFLQTMELYRLWGVQKVVFYLTSCSRDFQEVLDYYTQEGFLEIIPWRLARSIQENIHQNGQLSVMNECVYRNMYSSRYVLLADMDQLLVPYKHSSLLTLVEELQAQHPHASVFKVETHLFPSRKPLSKGSQAISGQDLLEHVHRRPIEENAFRSYKMVVNPRLVVQTAMFEVLKNYGETVNVPSHLARVMQIKPCEKNTEDILVLDTRIREFKYLLQPKVQKVVEKMLKEVEHS